MRPRAELDAIRDRVLAEIRANPPEGPLLEEAPPKTAQRPCKAGHLAPRRANGVCTECDRIGAANRRLERVALHDGPALWTPEPEGGV